nr:unnamed protein product [Callosobruchus chinensis]
MCTIQKQDKRPLQWGVCLFHFNDLPLRHQAKMIDWITTTLSSPPLLRRLSNEEIWAKITSGETAKEWNIDNFSCHTEAV